MKHDSSTSVHSSANHEGRELAFSIAGSGGPSVIVEPGLGLSRTSWKPIIDGVAHVCAVLSYDRAGIGASSPAEPPRYVTDLVADLRCVIGVSGLKGPFVIAGHSFGGLLSRVFADMHPDLVCGLVLIDSTHPDQRERTLALLPPESVDDSDALNRLRSHLLNDSDATGTPEGVHRAISYSQARVCGGLGCIPLVVVTGARPSASEVGLPMDLARKRDRLWLELQSELAGLATESRHLILPTCGHFIPTEAPAVLVENIVDTVLLVGTNRACEGG